jgi:hypothetical protein
MDWTCLASQVVKECADGIRKQKDKKGGRRRERERESSALVGAGVRAVKGVGGQNRGPMRPSSRRPR